VDGQPSQVLPARQGGWRVPQLLETPVILVIGMKLGCIVSTMRC
jgi:hypothetical protein